MIACPICGADTHVSETRASSQHTRRRRLCSRLSCHGRVTSVEVAVPTGVRMDGDLTVVPTEMLLAMRVMIDVMLGAERPKAAEVEAEEPAEHTEPEQAA